MKILIGLGIMVAVILTLALIALILYRILRKSGPVANDGSGPKDTKKIDSKKEVAEKKESKGKESPGPVWKFFRPILGFALGVGLALWVGFSVYRHFSLAGSGSILSRTLVTNFSYSVPMEIALPIIADCESGGGVPGAAHQFENDGKTPLKNREGSSAIGKYQILASDHEARAKSMGFDIRTEAGNESYARVLYSESGTKHWEADQRSVSCWGPKLANLGFGQGSVVVAVEAPVGKFSEGMIIPSGIYFDWGNSTDSFVLQDQKGSTAKYDPKTGVAENLPYPSKVVGFKSLSDKPAKVLLTLSKRPFR